MTVNNSSALLCDFYEMTMCGGFLKKGYDKKITYYDVFFRSVPDNGGFAVFAGLEPAINHILNLRFSYEDIKYLEEKNLFDKDFLNYLENFKFRGDIYAVKEGTPIFPSEPVMIVKSTAIEAQIIETFLLLTLNHQSLIATKSNRLVRAAGNKEVVEFGARRAQGVDAAVSGGRAAFIGGCKRTSCMLTSKKYNIPAFGTMAHSWVQMFDNEYEAFKAYCTIYPDNAVLLVDTYDTLKSGVPNAIKAIKEILLPLNVKKFAIRLDSGDIAYLSKKARCLLDKAGLKECKIIVSNSLNEYVIKNLISEGAKVDVFGVGENLITSKSSPVFGCVYKLCAVEENGVIMPKIKLSENTEKISTPHFKKIYRLIDKSTGKALADQICIFNESLPKNNLTIFNPDEPWKKKTITNYYAEELLVPIVKNGKLVYNFPSLNKIQTYCKQQVKLLWDEIKRFDNPHKYYVDLSEKLWGIKKEMISKYKN